MNCSATAVQNNFIRLSILENMYRFDFNNLLMLMLMLMRQMHWMEFEGGEAEGMVPPFTLVPSSRC